MNFSVVADGFENASVASCASVAMWSGLPVSASIRTASAALESNTPSIWRMANVRTGSFRGKEKVTDAMA